MITEDLNLYKTPYKTIKMESKNNIVKTFGNQKTSKWTNCCAPCRSVERSVAKGSKLEKNRFKNRSGSGFNDVEFMDDGFIKCGSFRLSKTSVNDIVNILREEKTYQEQEIESERNFNSMREEFEKDVAFAFDLNELKEYGRMIREDCDACNFLKGKLLERDPIYFNDVEERDNSWVKQHACNEQHHDLNCPIFQIDDFKWARVHGKPSPGFMRNCSSHLDGALFSLRFDESNGDLLELFKDFGFKRVSKKEQKVIRKAVRSNPYVIFMTLSKDCIFGQYENNGRFFKKLYDLRDQLGLNGDYGYRIRVESSEIAENDNNENNGISMTSIMKSLKEKTAVTWKSIKEVVHWLCNIIVGGFTGFSSFVSDGVRKFVENFKKFAAKILLKLVVPDEILKQDKSESFTAATILGMTVMIVTLVGIAGFVGTKLAINLIKKFSKNNDDEESMIAEADTSVIQLLTGFSLFGVGVHQKQCKTIRDHALLLTACMAGGSVVNNTLCHLFTLLPSTIRAALTYKFGSEDDKMRFEVHAWRANALALITGSKVSSVVNSKFFKDKVEDAMCEGQKLLYKLSKRDRIDLKNAFVSVYFKLFNVSTILTKIDMNSGTRKLPWSIHLAALPGRGKSLLIGPLLCQLTGCAEEEIYYRPLSEEYWNGYAGQKIVVMDEFLVGPDEAKDKVSAEYLQLISTNPFMPPMASVDDASVGMKGTIAAPEIVVTINNTTHDRPRCIDVNAFQRRRDCVIEMEHSVNYFGLQGAVDLTKYSEEEIRNFEHAIFRLHHPVADHNVEPTNWVKYDRLLEMLANRKELHDENCIKVAAALGGGMESADTAESKFNEILRRNFGLPTKPMEIGDAIAEFMGMAMQAEMEKEEYTEIVSKRAKNKRKKEARRKQKELLGEQEETKTQEIVKDVLSNIFDEALENPSVTSEAKSYMEYNRESLIDAGCRDYEEKVMRVKAMELEDNLEYGYSDASSSGNSDISYDDVAARFALDLDSISKTMNMQLEFVRRLRYAKSCGYLTGLTQPDSIVLIGEIDARTRLYLNTKVCYRSSPEAKTVLKCAVPGCDLIALIDDPRGGVFICQECDSARNRRYGYHKEGECNFNVTDWELESLNMLFRHGRQGIAFHMANGLTFRNVAKVSLISIGSIATIGFLTCCAITTMNHFRKKLFDKEGDDITFGPESAKPKPKSVVKSKVFVPKTLMKAQKSIPSVHRNFVLKWGATGQRRFNAIPIKNRYFLTFAHVFQSAEISFDKPLKLSLEENFGDPWKEITIDFDISRLVLLEDEDLAMFEFNGKCSESPNIMKKFVSRDNLLNANNIQVTMKDGNKTIHANARLSHNLSYHTSDKMYTLEDCWRYEAFTEPGDCGLPIIPFAGPLVNKIIGIHVAGSYIKDSNSKGMATLLPREAVQSMLECLGDTEEMKEENKFIAEASDLITDDDLKRPNVMKFKRISRSEEVRISTKTKIKPSFLNNKLSVEPQKAPAILSVRDPRSKGQDPIRNVLDKMFDSNNMEIDEEILSEVYDEMFEELNETLRFPTGRRELTFEEACAGVPGMLCSITTQTSPGWPLVYHKHKKGKTDFVWFEGGELKYTEEFRNLVDQFLEKMENYEGNDDELCRFLLYLKDEILKIKKIETVNTRATFCNNMIAIVAFRMKFGCILAAFSASGELTPDAIGLNPNSFDMNTMYAQTRVVGTDFGDGDFEKFDLRFQKRFQEKSYELLMKLAESYGVSKQCRNFFIDHEIKSPIQIGTYLIWLLALNRSGCFFTTISNDKVGEGYLRYVIKYLYRYLVFRDHVRSKHQGDDLFFCISKELKDMGFTPKILQKHMKDLLGQVYTPAQKDEEFGDEFKTFDEIMFLGSHPVKKNGKYTGALRKSTIWEMVQWTRDDNLTIDQTVISAIEHASQWGPQFYYNFIKEIKECYEEEEREMPPVLPYTTCSNIVANRTTANSGSTFYNMNADIYVAEMESSYEFKPPDTTVAGLTTIKTATMNDSNESYKSRMFGRESLGLNEEIMTLDYGQNSLMKRTSFSWSSAAAAGANQFAVEVPFGLLALGNSSNIQNMAWERFIYAVTEVEITLQINGTPTQQGSLIAYFRPLVAYAVGIENKPSFDHFFLMPNICTTGTLTMPFRFWRHSLNTYAGALGEETLGSFRVDVMTPLITDAATDCVITVYSRFKTNFRIARPIPPAGSNVIFGPMDEEKEVFVAEGATYSTSSVSNSYTISSVAGDVPIQGNGSTTDQGLTANPSLGLPLDNPPISGGSIPTHRAFSSMSKVVGLEPTISLQAHQQMLHREPLSLKDPDESTIGQICGKRGYLLTANWTTAQAVGDPLFQFPINSLLSTVGPTFTTGTTLPINLSVLNKFQRFRCDFVFEFLCAKTQFHSGRLIGTVAYGAPGIGTGQENVFLNTVMEFNGDNYWQTLRINYNAATEFLRTYDGTMAPDQVQDYSLGFVAVTVANRLRATSTVVANNVNVLMFVRLENVHVYEPKLLPMVAFTNTTVVSLTDVAADFVAEAGEIEMDTPVTGDMQTNTVVNQTAQLSNVQADKHCQLDLGRKFEYCLTDIHEVYRRHQILNPAYYGVAKTITQATVAVYDVYAIQVRPRFDGNDMFAAWSGHLKYRIFVKGSSEPCPVMYDAHPGDSTTALNSHIFLAPGGFKQQSSWSATTYITANTDTSKAVEMTFPIGTDSSMIDISIPFNSIYNFLPTGSNSATGLTNFSSTNGTIFIRIPTSKSIEVYTAAGDDFRYHVFYPRGNGTTKVGALSGAAVTPVGVANTELGGIMF